MFTCAREGCSNKYERRTHNQKYCTAACCRDATNLRIKQAYHERRAYLLGRERWCECGDKLSRYNESRYCTGCTNKRTTTLNTEIKQLLLAVT